MLNRKAMMLGYHMPDAVAQDVFARDSNPAVQTYRFSSSLKSTLEESYDELVCVGFCPIQDYPRGNKILFPFLMEGNIILLPFVNIIGLKHITRFLSLVVTLIFSGGKSDVVVHGLHSPVLLAVRLLSKLLGGTFVVITDEASQELSTDSKFRKFLKKIDRGVIAWLVSGFEGGIVLSSGLANRYKAQREFLVVPGILNDNFSQKYNRISQSMSPEPGVLTLYYAGTLDEKYGVKQLVDAVAGIDGVKLLCFGRGDQETYIRQVSKISSRISYSGFVEDDVLISAIKSSDVLVNPRPADTVMAEMSFPSKLFEYSLTGKPVLTTRLPSIPADLKDCFYFIDDSTVESIKTSILSLMSADKVELDRVGEKFKRTVFNEYSSKSISKLYSNYVLLGKRDCNV